MITFISNYYNFSELSSDEEVEETCIHNNSYAGVKYCVICCFDVLVKYNLYTNAYPSLYLAYKLMITLSVTQVSCERSFSKLKFVKNYLRNTLNQNLLESFMLMNVEKDILSSIDPNEIINELASRNTMLSKLLLF